MTSLLISVRDGHEAAAVSRFPVGIVDLKEPAAGALGMASCENRKEFLNTLPETIIKSIALGELIDFDSGWDPNQAKLNWLSQFQFAKVGLAHTSTAWQDWRKRWLELRLAMPTSTTLVGVAYADWQACGAPSIEEIFDLVNEFSADLPNQHPATDAARPSQPVVLVDTYCKSNGNLVTLLGWRRIEKLILRARTRRTRLVIAGSLTAAHLLDLILLQPDLIGFRGAICEHGRDRLSEKKLLELFEVWTRIQSRMVAVS
jgi:uncharacterized protein (UPF0264 family)